MGGTASRAAEISSPDYPQDSGDANISLEERTSLSIDDPNNNSIEHIVPTEFKWKLGGYSVYVTGAWDDWRQRTQLSRTTPVEFATVLALPVGTFQYKFIVDGNWRHSPSDPTGRDPNGNLNNVIVVTPQLPEYDSNDPLDTETLARSPVESYDYSTLPEEDHTTEPPSLPRILASAPIDRRSHSFMSGTDFVRLNHMFLIDSDSTYGSEQTRSLATEQRFKEKIITTILVTTKGRVPQQEEMSQQPYTESQTQPIPIQEAPMQPMSESQSLLLDALNNV